MVGEDSPCKESGQFCPELRVAYYDVDKDRDYSDRKTDFHYDRNLAPIYGEYFDFTGIVKFLKSELNPENAFTTIRIQGPGKSIMFEFYVFLTSYKWFTLVLYRERC